MKDDPFVLMILILNNRIRECEDGEFLPKLPEEHTADF